MKAWILQLLVFMVFTLPDLLHFSLFLSICFFLLSALFLTLSFFGWWLDVKVRFLDSSTASGKKKCFSCSFIGVGSTTFWSQAPIYLFIFPFCLFLVWKEMVLFSFSLIFLFREKKWGKVFFLFLILFRVLVSVFFFHDNNYRGKKGLFWKFHGVCMASEAKFLFVQGFCRKISSLHDWSVVCMDLWFPSERIDLW